MICVLLTAVFPAYRMQSLVVFNTQHVVLTGNAPKQNFLHLPGKTLSPEKKFPTSIISLPTPLAKIDPLTPPYHRKQNPHCSPRRLGTFLRSKPPSILVCEYCGGTGLQGCLHTVTVQALQIKGTEKDSRHYIFLF